MDASAPSGRSSFSNFPGSSGGRRAAGGSDGSGSDGRGGAARLGRLDPAAEDSVLAAARARAVELGCPVPSPAGGSTLRLLATALHAKAVVEVGTGTGVSGLWVLRGMRPDGVLTSIDSEPELQAVARLAFREASVPASRARLINGRPLDVLPRLADGYYDLMLVSDAPLAEYAEYLVEAMRLLRAGGAVAFSGIRFDAHVADATSRDPAAVVVRELLRAVRDQPDLTTAILPIDDGLLVAIKRL